MSIAWAQRVVVNAQKQTEVLVWMPGTGTIVQSNLPEFLKTVFYVSIYHSISSIFGENIFLEFEIVHQVLNISKKLATSLRFGK